MNRGRPREFDEDEALTKVMNCFRRRGYGGTTYEQLVDASGMSRSSLRNAFGDKDDLYQLALKRYSEQMFAPTFRMLGDEKKGGDLLRSMVQKMRSPADSGSVDCLLYKTMLHNATGQDEPKQIGQVRKNLTLLWGSISKTLGKMRKKRVKRLTAEERAAVIVGLVYGVKIISQNGKNKELVASISEAAVKLIEGQS